MTSRYPLPEEFSTTSCCFLLRLTVWWVLTETCCLGSSIMHPLPRDIMCDKWPISVQTPIRPWPGGMGGCERNCVQISACLFISVWLFAAHVRTWRWCNEVVLCTILMFALYACVCVCVFLIYWLNNWCWCEYSCTESQIFLRSSPWLTLRSPQGSQERCCENKMFAYLELTDHLQWMCECLPGHPKYDNLKADTGVIKYFLGAIIVHSNQFTLSVFLSLSFSALPVRFWTQALFWYFT